MTIAAILTNHCDCAIQGCACTRQTTEEVCAPCESGNHSDEDCHPLCQATVCRRNTIRATHQAKFATGPMKLLCESCARGWARNGVLVESIEAVS